MICVIIPCYKSGAKVLDVIRGIGPEVGKIIVIDDACPDGTGGIVENNINDDRLLVLRHAVNQGVGGACITGFETALHFPNCEIVVKLDSDGQMDPKLIPQLVFPISSDEADYAKGNRFYNLEYLEDMPAVRIFGNTCLSFLNKLSSGYWDIMDPTNGFIAVHAKILRKLPLQKLDKRFYFESDLLFRLSTLKARVVDVPIASRYADEISNLSVFSSFFRFSKLHASRFGKRIFYNYYLRDFNIASINLILGVVLLASGTLLGTTTYLRNSALNQQSPNGIIMLVMLFLIIGFQLLLSFINYDVSQTPKRAIHTSL